MMSSMSIRKMILFDIDGTLLLTGGVGAVALNQVFQEMFSVQDAWSALIPDGKTDPMIIDELSVSSLGRLLTAEERQKVTDRYYEIFEQNIFSASGFRLMPGVSRLLDTLSAREDLILGVATGNFEKAAWLKLKRGDIHSHFHFGGFGSDSHHRPELTRKAVERGFEKIGRELPPEAIWVIGDTQHDIHAGKSIGAHTVAVATGRLKAEEFKPYKPNHILSDLDHPEQFLKILEIH